MTLQALALVVYFSMFGNTLSFDVGDGVNKVQSCNYINDQNFFWIAMDTQGQYPPKAFSTAYHAPIASRLGPFYHEDSIQFRNDTIFYIDEDDDGFNKVFSIVLEGYEIMYVSYGDQYETALNQDPLGLLSSADSIRLDQQYQRDYSEEQHVLSLMSASPRGLKSNGKHATWTFLMDQSSFARDIRVVSLVDGAPVRLLTGNIGKPGLIRTDPYICGKYVLYLEVQLDITSDPTNGRLPVLYSEVRAYLMTAEYVEVVRSKAPLDRHPVFLSANEWQDDSGNTLCEMTWLETRDAIFWDVENSSLVTSAAPKDAEIRLFRLPSRDAFSLFPSVWSRGLFVRMTNFLMSEEHMVLVLATENNSVYCLRLFNTVDKVFRDFSWLGKTVSSIETRSQILLHSQSQDSFVFSIVQSEGPVVFVLVVGDGSTPSPPQMCRLPTPMGSFGFSIFDDHVVWRQWDSTKSQGVFYRLDLDKDNDGAFDIQDMFPIEGKYKWDSDNDGIGDEEDVIKAKGPCVTSENRSSCMSDIVVLYIVWGATVFIILAAVLLFLLLRRWLTRTRLHRSQSYSVAATTGKDPLCESDENEIATHDSMMYTDEAMGSRVKPRRRWMFWKRSKEIKKPPRLVLSNMVENSDTPSAKSTGRSSNKRVTSRAQSSISAVLSGKSFGKIDSEELDRLATAANPYASTLAKVVFTVQLLNLVLVVISVAIAVVPFYSYDPISLSSQAIFSWVDFFTSTVFAIDLIVRFLTRDRTQYPNLWKFFKDNWADFPSLVTDVPGVGGVGILSVFAITRLTRALRIFRIFKVFRVLRLYKRLTQQNIFIILIVERPTFFLMIFSGFMVIMAAIVIKITEQDSQEGFRSLSNTIWFTATTITTVGYGDYAPQNVFSRALSVLIASMGMGLVSALSAKIVQKVLTADKMQQRQLQVQMEMRVRKRGFMQHLQQIANAINPVDAAVHHFAHANERHFDLTDAHLAAVNKSYRRLTRSGSVSSLFSTTNSGVSSFANSRAVSRSNSIVGHGFAHWVGVATAAGAPNGVGLPNTHGTAVQTGPNGQAGHGYGPTLNPPPLVDQGMQKKPGGWKKLSLSNSPLIRKMFSIAEPVSHRHSIDSDITVDVEGKPCLNAAFRLLRMLKMYHLDQTSKSALRGDFRTFWKDLETLIFQRADQNKLYVEKIFAMDYHMKSENGRSDYRYYDLSDPLDAKEMALDEMLNRYGLTKRLDFDEIRDNLHTIILLQDRYDNAQWAAENLRYKLSVKPRPPYPNERYHGPPVQVKKLDWKDAVHKLRSKMGRIKERRFSAADETLSMFSSILQKQRLKKIAVNLIRSSPTMSKNLEQSDSANEASRKESHSLRNIVLPDAEISYKFSPPSPIPPPPNPQPPARSRQSWVQPEADEVVDSEFDTIKSFSSSIRAERQSFQALHSEVDLPAAIHRSSSVVVATNPAATTSPSTSSRIRSGRALIPDVISPNDTLNRRDSYRSMTLSHHSSGYRGFEQ